MEDKKIKIYKKIDDCISMIDEEIDMYFKNNDTVGDIETLEVIRADLEKMKNAMSPDVFCPTYDYILRDSLWDYIKISDKLLDVFYSYLKL